MPYRRVIHFDFVSKFVDYVLKSEAPATTVIVCSTKQTFLQNLCASVQAQYSNEQPGEPGGEGPDDSEALQAANEALLSDTIGAIAISQRITMVFCPSVEHLRAKLGVFQMVQEQVTRSDETDAHQSRPMLAILDPLAIHNRDSELSAQGLLRSLALAVEVAAREHLDLILCECPATGNDELGSGWNPWDIDVPLLSPSMDVTRGERPEGARRTMKAKQIAKRWFEFGGPER